MCREKFETLTEVIGDVRRAMKRMDQIGRGNMMPSGYTEEIVWTHKVYGVKISL